MKNLRLGIKLISGFILTALIALVIGIVGLMEIDSLTGHVEEISVVKRSLP
ncbi:hypothetical protein KJ966_29005 [bacterium]|nr:hypothetical protein [bacterium]